MCQLHIATLISTDNAINQPTQLQRLLSYMYTSPPFWLQRIESTEQPTCPDKYLFQVNLIHYPVDGFCYYTFLSQSTASNPPSRRI